MMKNSDIKKRLVAELLELTSKKMDGLSISDSMDVIADILALQTVVLKKSGGLETYQAIAIIAKKANVTAGLMQKGLEDYESKRQGVLNA